MARFRQFAVAFWQDARVEQLGAYEKILIVYSFTCSHRNELGLYQVSLRRMSNETGVPYDEMQPTIERIHRTREMERPGQPAIFVYDFPSQFIWVPNIPKYASLNNRLIFKSLMSDFHYAPPALAAAAAAYHKDLITSLAERWQLSITWAANGVPMLSESHSNATDTPSQSHSYPIAMPSQPQGDAPPMPLQPHRNGPGSSTSTSDTDRQEVPSTIPGIISPEGSPPGATAPGGKDSSSHSQKTWSQIRHSYEPAFDEWWKHYPRQEEKPRAHAQYRKAIAQGFSEGDLYNAMQHYVLDKHIKGETIFKAPKTFLNPRAGDFQPYIDWHPEEARLIAALEAGRLTEADVALCEARGWLSGTTSRRAERSGLVQVTVPNEARQGDTQEGGRESDPKVAREYLEEMRTKLRISGRAVANEG